MKIPRRSALGMLLRQRPGGSEVHALARRVAEHPTIAEHLPWAAVELSDRAFEALRLTLSRPEVPEHNKRERRERSRELQRLRRKCSALARAAGDIDPHPDQGPEQRRALARLYARSQEIFDSTHALLNRALDVL